MDNAPAAKKPLYRSLYFQAICASVVGILLGYFYPHSGAAYTTPGAMTGTTDLLLNIFPNTVVDDRARAPARARLIAAR